MRPPTNFSLLWLGCAMLCVASSAVAEGPSSAEQLAANAIRAGQTRDLSAVKSLSELLSHESRLVRQSCAWALTEFGESASEAVSSLTHALDDSDARVRWASATALGRIGRQASSAESALWQATLDRDIDARCAALIALRAVSVVKHSAALSALSECLRSPAADVQAEAIATLTAVHSRWDENEKLPIASQLATVFAKSNDDLRLAVAVLLGDLGLPSASVLTALACATDDIDEHVQAAAQRAVGRFVDEIDQRWNQLDAKQRQDLRPACETAAKSLEARGRASIEVARLAEEFQRLINGIQMSSTEGTVVLQRTANSSPQVGTAATPGISSGASPSLPNSWRWGLAALLTAIGLWGLRQGLSGRLAASVQSTNNTQTEVAPLGVDTSSGEIGARSEAINSLNDSVLDTVSPFVQALRDDDACMRQAAAITLGRIGPGAIDAVPQLILALADTDPRVRAAAAFALSVFGAHAMEAVPALRAALSDEFAAVRARAAFALGQIGPSARRAAEELARLVSDPDVSVRRNIASALGGIGADTAVVLLALRQAAGDVDAGVRQCAMTTLAMIDTEGAAVASLRPQHNVDGEERQCAQSVPECSGLQQTVRDGVEAESEELRAINPSLVLQASFAAASSETHTDQIASGLKLFCPEQMDEPVVACDAEVSLETADFIAQLENVDADVRWNASQGLGKLGASAVPEMIASLNHRNPGVRRLLIVALGRVGVEARSAMPAMLVALHDVNADVRACAAADCLGQLGVVSRSMVQALVQSLCDPNAEVRRYAATTLGRFGQQARESTTALQIASISDISAKVRTAAQTALQRISEPLVGAA